MLIDKNLIQLIQDLHAARADNAALRARLAETEHDRDAFQSLLNDSFETNNDMTEQLAQAEPIIAAVAERHELTVYTAPEETDPRRLALRLCGDCGVMGVPPLKHDDTCLYDKARAYLAARADAEHAQSPVGGTNDGRGNGGNGEFTFANLGEPTADAEPAGEVGEVE